MPQEGSFKCVNRESHILGCVNKWWVGVVTFCISLIILICIIVHFTNLVYMLNLLNLLKSYIYVRLLNAVIIEKNVIILSKLVKTTFQLIQDYVVVPVC